MQVIVGAVVGHSGLLLRRSCYGTVQKKAKMDDKSA